MDSLELFTVTIKIQGYAIEKLEKWLRKYYNVISTGQFKDSPKMYEEDKYYRDLIKQKKDLTKSIELYRNKNIYKYND
tara:strand:- start:379 stop:612 length:234 start_codon:yes stop_codon:yes gene_type:complete